MNILIGALVLYYAAAVLSYWRPLAAVWRRPTPARPRDLQPGEDKPLLIVVAPCLGASGAIPGMVECLQRQDYPAQRYRKIILIDRDGETDPSAEIARTAGAEVIERVSPAIRTKGSAINELLQRQLADQPWDALVILDIDSRVNPDFLGRVAAYLRQGDNVLQGAPRSKDAGRAVMRLNHAGQLLSQLIQRGRAALGLSAILSGACMVFSRQALGRLGWQTSTGRRLSDDGELNFRCLLNDLPVTYAPDLEVLNDLPHDIRAVQLQRRRWFAAYVEGLPYVGPLLRKGLAGSLRSLEGLFTLLFLPGSSLTFAMAGAAVLVLGTLYALDMPAGKWFVPVWGLWLLHLAFYFAALATVGGRLGWSEIRQVPAFLGARVAGIGSGIVLGSRRNPGRHSVPFKAPAKAVEERPREHVEQGR